MAFFPAAPGGVVVVCAGVVLIARCFVACGAPDAGVQAASITTAAVLPNP